jgi:hypothetical protein
MRRREVTEVIGANALKHCSLKREAWTSRAAARGALERAALYRRTNRHHGLKTRPAPFIASSIPGAISGLEERARPHERKSRYPQFLFLKCSSGSDIADSRWVPECRSRGRAWSAPCSITIRTARSRTSGAYFGTCFLLMAPTSQRREPPANPGRFTIYR